MTFMGLLHVMMMTCSAYAGQCSNVIPKPNIEMWKPNVQLTEFALAPLRYKLLGEITPSETGAKFFLLKLTSFQKGLGMQESKQEFTKVVSLVTNGGKCT